MNRKVLSIVIPVYNVENYLKVCLDSIVYYDNDNIEIVIVNDGSTDNSLCICQDYASKYSNIVLINQNNQGLSGARNTGIMNASGDFILFLDSDDFLKKGVLTNIISDIKKENRDFYLGRAFKYNEDKNSLELYQIDYNKINYQNPINCFIDLHKISKFWFAAWLIVINRNFLIENNLFFKSGIYHEDELWVPTIFVNAKNMGFLNYGFYCYRTDREGSIVATPKIKREFDKIIVADELGKLIDINPLARLLIKNRQASIIFGIILSFRVFINNPQLTELKFEIRNHLKLLKYGKYNVIYWFCKIFGVDFTSTFLSFFIKF